MGCATSKHEDLPAVLLCRERCSFLDEAIHHRYAFAEAHIAYLHSLKSVGGSLHRFFQHELEPESLPSSVSPLSPILNRKPDLSQPSGKKPAAVIHQRHDSHSSSGSHLHFHSESGSDDDSGSESLHHHTETRTPTHGNNNNPYGNQFTYADHETLPFEVGGPGGYGAPYQVGSGSGGGGGFGPPYQAGGFGAPYQVESGVGGGFGAPYQVESGGGGGYGAPYPVGSGGGAGFGAPYQAGSSGYMRMNYMRKQATPSVTYQQRPISPATVRMGEASSSSYYPSPYPNNSNNNPNPNYPVYPNYGGGPYGVSSPPAPPSGAGPSTSKPPPPPPSPPRNSPWDFLNPFETLESTNYVTPYTPSRDLREVREAEGIPDLEEEDFEHEVVKEVHGHQKFVEGENEGHLVEEEREKESDSEAIYRGRPSVASMENEQDVEYEVHVVDKKVVDEEGKSNVGGGFKARAFEDDSDVVKEIQVQFERASEYGNELAKVLEVGKVPHNRKHATYQVSSKMLHAITPSLSVVSSQPSTSKSAEIQIADPVASDVEGDVTSRYKNLSSTLNKLYLWEKKLYQEVKSEEKIRVLHERKSEKLTRLDQKGAEAHKIDMTRQLVRSLSTKIRIAIQVVDKISEKINKMRDEELWPQLNVLIKGLSKMWKGMLECHHNQCQAIGEAKRLDAIASHKHLSDAHLEATLHLEQELLNWTLRFSCWVNAQKGYVKALNTWLMKCLFYVPEETADGRVPFSPGRIGAPPIFVICNQWSQTIEGVSEKEVIDRMRDFASNVLQLWERDKHEMRQRMMLRKDMERKVKSLEREDQKIQKGIHALGKRIVLVSGDESGLSLNRHVVYQSDTSKNSSLQAGLRHIFEAMERFTAKSLKVYEELLQRIEEDDLA
ncbi:protein ALTERED PHOSPHATE STARVATION RESPONSE 1-like [Lycium barbarum]|uniref:protein ALTERED PHOSPHATE STARVATION RESPONSE 1-like n=1 Tax=Lycium barbarum TaxID=112863 RepID=UPI00293EC657|nr:protein ALTERED PHOSPHATE STARVATION RESPONSE 1-like [Lycium barbarum]